MKKIVVILSVIVLFSCKKDNESHLGHTQAPLAPTGPGSFTGKVTQYDQYGVIDVPPLNNVTVSIAATSYSTTTDVNGNYTLTSIPGGSYDLLFSRAGCGTWKILQAFVVPLQTRVLNGYSVEIPTYSFSTISLKDTSLIPGVPPRLWVEGTLTPVNKSTGIIVIYNETGSPDISIPSSFKVVGRYNIPANTTTIGAVMREIANGTVGYYKVYSHSPTIKGLNFDSSAVYYNNVSQPFVPSYGTDVPGTFTVSTF